MKIKIPGTKVELDVWFKRYGKVIKCYIVENYVNCREVEFTAIVKCHEDDVFNSETGERLALTKALSKREQYIKKIITDSEEMFEQIITQGSQIAVNKFKRKWRHRNK